jgi:IS5 family transposase
MKAKKTDPQGTLFSFSMNLSQICDRANELYVLADKIDWSVFERAFGPLYCEDNGRAAKPIRLMVGLHILKAMFDESDESVVLKWIQNPYWQYFCGETEFQHEFPVDFTLMGKWRKRVNKEGFDKILESSIDAAIKSATLRESDLTVVNVDTTVLEKAITFPTDAKLYHRMRVKLVDEANRLGLPLRQSYRRKSKKALIWVGRYSHARQMKRSNKALRSVKTMFGRVLRDIERKAKTAGINDKNLNEMVVLGYRLFKQKREDKNKIYSLHCPEVECIAKGKAHKKYEFGCKVSFVTSSRGNFFLSAQALHGNPFDGHTLKEALKDAEQHLQSITKNAAPSKNKITDVFVDQGYKGHGVTDQVVTIVGKNQKNAPPSLKKWMKRRAAIEPLIGHAKNDGGDPRNHLLGKSGDQICALMMAIGFNFRKVAKRLRLALFSGWLRTVLSQLRPSPAAFGF